MSLFCNLLIHLKVKRLISWSWCHPAPAGAPDYEAAAGPGG